jgi:TonB-linked SusC/RagA family outer membrane protein
MDKYLLTASVRWDGASRLADGHKWDYFPSVAAAWHLGDESFMDPVRPYANDVKLRVSYGVTGNSTINIYGTQGQAEYAEEKFAFGDISAPTIGFGTMITNKNLGWEKSASIDVGLDISFFNSRVNLTADYYNTKTTDILMKRKISSTAGGFNASVFETYQNIASTRNQGVELMLNTVNIQKSDWRWTTTFTFSRNKEEILSLFDDLNEIIGSSLFVGYPVKSFYNWEKLGIWQSSEAQEAAQYTEGSGSTTFKPGDFKIKDQNGDYKITDEDKVIIGSEVPKWFAGLNNTVSYKSFDLSIYLFARWGQMINAEFLGRYEPEGVNNGPAYFEYWTPGNETNDFPAPGKAKSSYTYFSTLNYVDGSYFKIKTLSIGYTLPRKYAQALRLERLRIYATANNLFTVAKSHLIKYYDPERGGSEKTPLSKQFVVGINLEF